MRRVVTISLNGNAYALEEDAADALGHYLESARLALQANTDQAEILADLEQAIAEKSQRFLGAHKTVLTRAEIAQILTEMGPVENEPAERTASPQPPPASPSLRPRQTLYRIRQGQQVGGVCNGLAAYFGLDVTWVRLGFLLFAFLWGVTGVVYLALMIVLPVANTPEELAAAYGEPFNAREYVERARREASELANRDWSQNKAELKAGWERSKSFVRAELRESLRSWRERRRAARRRRTGPPSGNPAVPPAPAAPKTHALQQILIVFLTLPLIVLFGGLALVWIMAMFALITTGTLFGLLLPFSLPIWLAILFLLMIFGLITWPLRLLMRLIAPGQPAVAMQPAFSFIESLVGVAAFVAITFWAYHHFPAVTTLIDTIREHVSALLERLSQEGVVKVET
jgi:phage shock protein PspC (stress-responsive transcriptional regulator)